SGSYAIEIGAVFHTVLASASLRGGPYGYFATACESRSGRSSIIRHAIGMITDTVGVDQEGGSVSGQ
ncbi:MAG: hypothetical protein M3256_19945, partial [Actinomycetota bacterium]|nr:hypothetical protein [Actinomycetota bacterium]